MTTAANALKVMIVAAVVLVSSFGWSGQTVPSADKSDQLLLPFSSSLPLPGLTSQGPARLKHLIEHLDYVRRAEVQVSGAADRPEVLVLLTWRRPASARDANLGLIVSLALRTLPGLKAADLVLADSSGAVLYDGSRPPPLPTAALRPATPPFLIAAAFLAATLLALLGLRVSTHLLARRRSRNPTDARPVPPQLAGRPVRDLAAILLAASPAVRGSILASLPDNLRGRLLRLVRRPVDWPARPPEPAVLAAALEALLDQAGGRR
jgi:hypothetical protein